MHSKSSGCCFVSSCWTSVWCAHAHCDDSIPSQRVEHGGNLPGCDAQLVIKAPWLCVLGCFCGNLLQYYNSNVEWTPWPLEQASCPSQVLIRQNGPYDVRFEVVKTLSCLLTVGGSSRGLQKNKQTAHGKSRLHHISSQKTPWNRINIVPITYIVIILDSRVNHCKSRKSFIYCKCKCCNYLMLKKSYKLCTWYTLIYFIYLSKHKGAWHIM